MTEDLSILTRSTTPPDDSLAYGPDPDQLIDIRFGSGQTEKQPLVAIFHGGFWRPHYDRLHISSMAAALAASGWTVASIEYRKIPGDPDATLGDVCHALEKVLTMTSRHNGHVVVVGHSAGGQLALWAAGACSNRALSGTLALAPVADLRLAHELDLGDGAVAAFLGGAPEHRGDIDPQRLKAPATAVTVMHGLADDTVPVAVSESYVSAHPRTRLVRLEDVGHFALIDPLSRAWPKVVEEVKRLSDA